MQSKRTLAGVVLSLVLVGGALSEPALARGRGGARPTRPTRAQGGTWNRQGTLQGSRQGNPGTFRSGGSWSRQGQSGTFQRQGSSTGPQGKTGTYQGQGSWQRGEGTYRRQYDGTRTGPNGQTQQVNREHNVQRTGENTYSRQGSQTVTGSNGESRTRSYEGQGSVQKTDDGYTRNYDGTITNARGQQVNVDRSVDVSKNADGTVTKDRSVDYSHPDGTPLRSGESNTVITPGQGSQTDGSWTNHVKDQTSTYQGSRTRTEGGYDQQGTWTGPQGNTRSQNSRVRWQYVDGRWVRMVEGSNSNGGTLQSTTNVEPGSLTP